jgi:hypothetical protein
MKYVLRFHGRKIGAIGVFSDHEVEVELNSPEEAGLRVYDTHEHIGPSFESGLPNNGRLSVTLKTTA